MNHPKSMFQLSGVHCMVLAALQQSIKAAECNLFLINSRHNHQCPTIPGLWDIGGYAESFSS